MEKIKTLIYLFVFILLMGITIAYDCNSLPGDIEIDIDSEPYIQETNAFFGILPEVYHNSSFKCFSYIKDPDYEVIQVNPQKTTYREVKIPFFSKRTENREYFTTQHNIVNAYFTQKDVVSYTEFVLGLMCVEGDTELVGEKCITPQYQDLKNFPTRAIWVRDNAEILLISFITLFLVLIVAGTLYRNTKKLF